MICVGKPSSNRLVDEEHVHVFVPSVGVVDRFVGPGDSARAKFHEETDGGGASRTAICPEYDVVLSGVAPAFEVVEEKVAGFDVDISGMCSLGSLFG